MNILHQRIVVLHSKIKKLADLKGASLAPTIVYLFLAEFYFHMVYLRT